MPRAADLDGALVSYMPLALPAVAAALPVLSALLEPNVDTFNSPVVTAAAALIAAGRSRAAARC